MPRQLDGRKKAEDRGGGILRRTEISWRVIRSPSCFDHDRASKQTKRERRFKKQIKNEGQRWREKEVPGHPCFVVFFSLTAGVLLCVHTPER